MPTSTTTSPAPPRRGARRADVVPSPTVRGVAISSPDRVVFPDAATTKLDVARYVDGVADLLLPHVVGRPLSIVRCPGGAARPCFYQRHLGKTPAPAGVQSAAILFGSNPEPTFVVREARGLVGLVQMNGLELHPWGCRADDAERPDRMVFDLDPAPDLPRADLVAAAHDVRARLAALSLVSFVKTTGGKGLHVVAPLSGRDGWDDVHAWTRAFAVRMSEDAPDRFTANMRKVVRTGRVFVDWGRNGRGATAVAPYSTRARPGGPVSMPVPWDDVVADMDLAAFTVATAPLHLARRRVDPWAGFFAVQQALPGGVA